MLSCDMCLIDNYSVGFLVRLVIRTRASEPTGCVSGVSYELDQLGKFCLNYCIKIDQPIV